MRTKDHGYADEEEAHSGGSGGSRPEASYSQGSLAAEAALRHSDVRPGGAALRMTLESSAGSRLMHWLWIPFMGRCREPVSGRRDPKRSPTGASIGIPQAGRRRLKNPASQN